MDNISALPIDHDYSAEGDESALLRAAQADPAAFGELYRRYLPSIYRYLRMRAVTDEDAADLAQQVFLQALNALPKYRDRGLPFAVWLFRIARNVAADAHRRRRNTTTWDLLPEALQPTDAEDPEAEVLRREELERLRALLHALDPDTRDLVTLHFVGRLSQREIAQVLGTSQANVQRRLARTLRALKEQYLEG